MKCDEVGANHPGLPRVLLLPLHHPQRAVPAH